MSKSEDEQMGGLLVVVIIAVVLFLGVRGCIQVQAERGLSEQDRSRINRAYRLEREMKQIENDMKKDGSWWN